MTRTIRFSPQSVRRRFRLATGWIGIDIGSVAIKVAQVSRQRGRYELSRSLLIPAPEGRIFDRQSIEHGEVAELVRQAKALHGGFVGNAAACLLSMSHCDLRTVLDTPTEEEERRRHRDVDAARNDPGLFETPQTALWNAADCLPNGGNGATQAQVLSLSNSLAESLGTNLLAVRLKCQVLDSLPFCASRAVEMEMAGQGDPCSGGFQMVLDWGWSSTAILAFCGRPVFVRCLRGCGYSRLVESLAGHLCLTRTQALALVGESGSSTSSTGGIAADLQQLLIEVGSPLIRELAEELKETLAFTRARYTDASSLLMTGGGAISGLDRQLALALRIPVRRWNLPASAGAAEAQMAIFHNAAALSALAWEL